MQARWRAQALAARRSATWAGAAWRGPQPLPHLNQAGSSLPEAAGPAWLGPVASMVTCVCVCVGVCGVGGGHPV